MIDLFLLRHGIAFDSTTVDATSEVELPLTVKGKNRTQRAARGLRALGVTPEVILTSPWTRSVQTARIVVGALQVAGSVLRETDALLPEAPLEELWRELRSLDRTSYLCVGHSPHLESVMAALLGLGDTNRLALKKAGAACFQVRLEATVTGQLTWFLQPRTLRDLADR